MSLPSYEVFAIKYGDRVGSRGTIFVHGDPHDAPLAMDYFVWAIRGPDRTIVVDVGYGREEGEGRGRSFLRCPTEGLSLVGIDAAEVEDVVITHMHYDHAGNLALFPKARFHIQDDEMAFVTGRAMTHESLRHSFVLDDVLEMVR
ncbi:MAG: MBL fold metallo-hydrolase, partial [Alphaproteobacteria bacterium]|nr:MBL fold metallo-hydrolase [Alphaproteobacteria bacterium]